MRHRSCIFVNKKRVPSSRWTPISIEPDFCAINLDIPTTLRHYTLSPSFPSITHEVLIILPRPGIVQKNGQFFPLVQYLRQGLRRGAHLHTRCVLNLEFPFLKNLSCNVGRHALNEP